MSTGVSDPGEGALDRLLAKRLLSFQDLLKEAREGLEAIRLPGHSQPPLKLVQRIIDSLIDEINVTSEELAFVENDQDKFRRTRSLHDSLEQFVHFVHTVVLASRSLPSALFQMIEMAESQLPKEWQFGFLIWNYTDLATLNMNSYMAKVLQPFVNTRQSMDDEPQCWVFGVPRSILDEPLNWPLVAHEIAHVLEQSQLHAVESVYGPRPARTPDPYEPKVLKFRHAEEYQADFLAAYFFGPSFIMRIVSSYFSQEIHISATHPAWEERIEALRDVGLPKLPSSAFYKTLISDAIKGISFKGGMVAHEVVDLPAILEETAKQVTGKLPPFDCESPELKKARERLGRFLPYAEDYRCLLNAAVLEERTGLSAYQSEALGPSGREEREYRYLVADCTRLCYVNMHYRIRRALEDELSTADTGKFSRGPVA